MQFNAKDDFITEQQKQEELDEYLENKRGDEEDTGYDNPDIPREIPDMEFWSEQAFENEKHGFISAIDDHVEEL